MQVAKVIYAKSSPKPAKDFGTASKDQQYFISRWKAVFRCLKTSDWYFLELVQLKFHIGLAYWEAIQYIHNHKSKFYPDKVKTLHSTSNVKYSVRSLNCKWFQPIVSYFSTAKNSFSLFMRRKIWPLTLRFFHYYMLLNIQKNY